MSVPKSATKAVATFRLVQVRDKEFVCERASRDAVGSVSWTADKDALTQCLGLALVGQLNVIELRNRKISSLEEQLSVFAKEAIR